MISPTLFLSYSILIILLIEKLFELKIEIDSEKIELFNQKIAYLENLNTNLKIEYEHQLNIANNLLNDLKIQHENKLNEMNTTNLEQLKSFESNFSLIQSENDELKTRMYTLTNETSSIEHFKQFENENIELKSQIDRLREQINENSTLIHQLNESNSKLNELQTNFNLIQYENHELKLQIEQMNQFSDTNHLERLDLIEQENNELKSQIDSLREQTDQNSTLISQLNEANYQLNTIQAENQELKLQIDFHKNQFNETAYMDQLKQYETSFSSLQTENDELRVKIDELNVQVGQQNELKEKLNTIEQLNLKYKAKLKQLIAKSKLAESSMTSNSNDLLMIEEQRSSNATPISHSPMFHSPMAVVKVSATQTEFNLDECLNRSMQLDIEINELKAKLNQAIEERNILDEKNLKLESLKLEYENHIRQLNETKYEEKIENTILVKSSQVSIDNDEVERLKEECKSLKERLETTQQQNLKLKAKLKSVLNSNKGEKSSKEQESEKV